jgi:ssDNA-binding Zn-finger/Zn-ribbon topoisomerase 1
MQLRTGRFGPFYTSTHDCGETKPFAKRVGVACPKDGGEILEKRSKKGRPFYGCANWPNCDWVSFNRPLVEPCPQCGGIQVDMGRGRVRCLKHEGEPPRFAARAPAKGKAEANGKTVANGRVAANGKVAPNGKAAANGKPKTAKDGAAKKPRRAAAKKA